MKKSVLSIFFTLVLFSNLYSQSRWIDVRSLPALSSGDRYEDVYFLNAYTGYVIHINGKIFKTTDGGRSFALKSDETNGHRSVGFFDENTGIVGRLNVSSPIMRTTNGGVNFTNVTAINGVMPTAICGLSILNSTTAFGVGVYSCPAYFVKTTDKGASWTSYSMETTQIKSLVDCYFWSADSGIVVGGYNPTNNYNVSNSVVLFTSNGGKTFTSVFKSTRTGEWGWKISFVNKNTGYVAVEAWNYSVVLKTTNRGLNWTDRQFTTTENLEGIGFINENTGWIGGWGGYTYQTTNSGISWTQTPWSRLVNRFRFISDTLGYCVGNSFYKYTQELVGVTTISEEIPGEIYLHQNYPNPFNPSTRINYELRLAGLIKLIVYDAKGNEVETLVNENQKPGIYSAEFTTASLPSGIYFYKLVTDSFTETKKMVLIK